MDRADEFIQLFNQVAQFLSRLVNQADYVSFEKLVRVASENNAAVKANASALGQFAKLRNAIVHDAGYPLHKVAIPSPEALSTFSRVVREVIEPIPLIPTFERPIRCFSPSDTLSAALGFMREHDFSQVVVRGVDGKLGMVTVEGIAWRLADGISGILPPADAAAIGEILTLEPPGVFKVMDARKNIYDAVDAFRNSIRHDSTRLSAILITKNGELGEEPIGFITPSDLVHYAPLQ
jgi:CBS domain-containing protein